MGLTIHYTLSVKRGTKIAWLKNLLRRTQRLARKNGCAHVGKVLHSTETVAGPPPFFDSVPGRERRLHGGGRGTHGWLLEVWPGEGCETAVFGILQHRRILSPKKGQPEWQTRYSKRSDWKLATFCKTQYAGEHGWEHFRACHLRVIQLLDLWREAGARMKVWDEGCYWKTRSETKLRQELGDYDHLAVTIRIFEHAAQPGDEPVIISQLLAKFGFLTRFPIAAFIPDFHPRARLTPQIQQLDDPQMARAEMFPAMLTRVLGFAKCGQLPIRAFRIARLPFGLPFFGRQDAPVLQDAKHRRLTAFARPHFQKPAVRAPPAAVQTPLASGHTVEKRRRAGHGFCGMENLADVGATVLARQPLGAAQKVFKPRDLCAAFHRQRVMDGPAHDYCAPSTSLISFSVRP